MSVLTSGSSVTTSPTKISAPMNTTLSTAPSPGSITNVNQLANAFVGAVKNTSINAGSQIAAQSAVNGESVQDAIKNQGTNILLYAAGELAANQIGDAAHPNGDLVIVAANNINNRGSNITAEGSGYLEATNGNINIATTQLRDKTTTEGGSRKKRWVSITDNTTNIQSNINIGTGNAGGSLDIIAKGTTPLPDSSPSETGNINIKGSSITTKDNITLTAKNDVNITSAQDSNYSFRAGRTGRGKSYLDERSSVTQISGNITTTNNGDINVNSGVGNVDVIGAADAPGSINLIASNLTTQDNDNNNANNVGDGDVNLIAKENLNISSALNTSYYHSLRGKKGGTVKKSNEDVILDQINVSSNITANGNISNNQNAGDINTTSGNNTTITASNLTGENGNILVGKYTNPNNPADVDYNPDAVLTIKSGQDLHYSYHHEQVIKTSEMAVAVGAVTAAAVVAVAVAAAAPSGGTSAALVTAAPSIGAAAAGGAASGMGGKKGKTITEETIQIKQIASNLDFANNLNINSGSDVTITASNLTADTATILTGKFRDHNTHIETITNTDAALNINSAFDTNKTTREVERVKPNYVGVALVAGLGAYGAHWLEGVISPVGKSGPQIPLVTIGNKVIPSYVLKVVGIASISSSLQNIIPNNKPLLDPVINTRSENLDSYILSKEVKVNMSFNNLTIE